jgi:hypothetical protein
MNKAEDQEKQVAELRSEVAQLKKVIIYGSIAVAVLFTIPLLPILLGIFAAFVLVFGTIGALLGKGTGRLLRARRGKHFRFPIKPRARGITPRQNARSFFRRGRLLHLRDFPGVALFYQVHRELPNHGL